MTATGQDEILKSELRMAGLRHFALACTYGHRAQRIELVIQAGTVAWNVMVRIATISVAVCVYVYAGITWDLTREAILSYPILSCPYMIVFAYLQCMI